MRSTFVLLILAGLACIYFVRACEPEESQDGCKIYGVSCTCGYGCKNEFIYKSRRACLSALRERSSNVCYRMPCLRGICIQTMQKPGFTCKCEGTGYFGYRCEKERRDIGNQRLSHRRRTDFQTMPDNLDISGTGLTEKDNRTLQLCRLVHAYYCCELYGRRVTAST